MAKAPRRRVVSQFKERAAYWTLTLECGHEKLTYITPKTTLCWKCLQQKSAAVDRTGKQP